MTTDETYNVNRHWVIYTMRRLHPSAGGISITREDLGKVHTLLLFAKGVQIADNGEQS